jgi:hypothetical protein
MAGDGDVGGVGIRAKHKDVEDYGSHPSGLRLQGLK